MLLLVGSLPLGARAAEPAVVLSPAKPVTGETLQITYNPAASTTGLSVADGVYVVAWAVYSDGWHDWEAYPAARVDDRFVCTIPIRPPLCQLSISIANRFGVYESPEALANVPIYRPDGQPVRHATASQMDDVDFDAAHALFDKEMALYPDNYYAYLEWWQSLKRHDPSQYETVLADSLRKIERTVTGTPLDYQFVRVAACLDLHNGGEKGVTTNKRPTPAKRSAQDRQSRHAPRPKDRDRTCPAAMSRDSAGFARERGKLKGSGRQEDSKKPRPAVPSLKFNLRSAMFDRSLNCSFFFFHSLFVLFSPHHPHLAQPDPPAAACGLHPPNSPKTQAPSPFARNSPLLSQRDGRT
jgi:hypothetical protein